MRDKSIKNEVQEGLSIIDEVITKFFEYYNNEKDVGGDGDTYNYSDIFFKSLPCFTKPTVLKLSIFLFANIDLTSLIGDPILVNFYNTNTFLHASANAHSNAVSGLEKKEESVDDGNKEATALDSHDKDLSKEESENSSCIKNNSDDDKRGLISKKVKIAKERNFFLFRSTTAGIFRKDFCHLPQNFFILSLSNIFYV